MQWQRSTARPVSVKALQRVLPSISAEQIVTWLETGQGGPVMRAAAVLDAVLTAHPCEEAMALILADAALAQSLGWRHIVPLLAAGLKSRDLHMRGTDLQLACHKALLSSIGVALQITADVTRRADHLRTVIPKLRAKAAGDAVALFLSKDALSPSVALAELMSDRAARRLCDRLVDLGVVRELTGRDTFRLYGV
jgi:hypothetical protein